MEPMIADLQLHTAVNANSTSAPAQACRLFCLSQADKLMNAALPQIQDNVQNIAAWALTSD